MQKGKLAPRVIERGYVRVANLANGKRVWTKLYGVWNSVKGRCYSSGTKDYPNYGGRGIKVCPEWHDYHAFRSWALANGYKPGLELNRKDNDGDYSPDNCNWATRPQQCLNKRSTIIVKFQGREAPLWVLARRLGMDTNIVRYRYRKLGWTAEQALLTPVGGKPNQYSEDK